MPDPLTKGRPNRTLGAGTRPLVLLGLVLDATERDRSLSLWDLRAMGFVAKRGTVSEEDLKIPPLPTHAHTHTHTDTHADHLHIPICIQ